MTLKIYHGDCLEIMRTLSEESVDLLVTSPPYNCGKNYNSVSDNMSVEDYLLFTSKWLLESFRLIRFGGRIAVNIPWWMGKKPRHDFEYSFKSIALSCGFIFLDKIIWIKGKEGSVHVSGGFGGGGCGWGTWMSPSGPAIRCASEPILIFAKGSRGRKMISGLGKGDCLKSDITKEEFLAWTMDTWFVKGAHSKEHPAVFPLDIPKRLIKLYTYPNDVVLDPFLGSGTSAVAAMDLSRQFIGIELDYTYFYRASERMSVYRELF